MEFSILGLEIGIRPKSIGHPARHSTTDRLGLLSRVKTYLKEEELFYPVTERLFKISIQIFNYLESSFNQKLFLNFRHFSFFFDRFNKISTNKVQNVFMLRYRMALPLPNEPSYDSLRQRLTEMNEFSFRKVILYRRR